MSDRLTIPCPKCRREWLFEIEVPDHDSGVHFRAYPVNGQGRCVCREAVPTPRDVMASTEARRVE